MMQMAAPKSSTFSCWRGSPAEDREFTACQISQASEMTPSRIRNPAWATPSHAAAPAG